MSNREELADALHPLIVAAMNAGVEASCARDFATDSVRMDAAIAADAYAAAADAHEAAARAHRLVATAFRANAECVADALRAERAAASEAKADR